MVFGFEETECTCKYTWLQIKEKQQEILDYTCTDTKRMVNTDKRWKSTYSVPLRVICKEIYVYNNK